MLSLSILQTPQSMPATSDELMEIYQLIPHRVAPILKDAIQAGKINLTAIVNTHQ